MDTLSDVLQTVRLTGAIFFDLHVSEPWVAEAPAGKTIVKRLFPDADHLIPYHAVTRGSCWGALLDSPPLPLSAGDVIVFPHGDPHVISSAPGMRRAPDLTLYRRPSDRQLPFSLSMGERPSPTTNIVCGYFACDSQPFNPLLSELPRVFGISRTSGGEFEAFVRIAVAESKTSRIGGESVLSRLSELMFVYVIRRYLEMLPADRVGWLAGLRDPAVGRALTALHRRPAHPWTIASLAHEVGVSRSVLADRFTHVVGQPAMRYLTSWRMQLASSRLRSTADTVTAIAEQIGYESEAAFSRAFKKFVGVSPSAWRQRRSRPTRRK